MSEPVEDPDPWCTSPDPEPEPEIIYVQEDVSDGQ